MVKEEMQVRLVEEGKNGIFTASTARIVADNENANLKISKLIMEYIIDAANDGLYQTKVDINLEGEDIPGDILDQINTRIPYLFRNYGYNVEVFDIIYFNKIGFIPTFSCTIAVNWILFEKI